MGSSQKSLDLLRQSLEQCPSLEGFDLLVLEQTDSTNDRAFEHCKATSHPVLVSAELQTRGRGSHGRQWVSDAEGNVYLSVGLPIFQPPTALGEKSVALAHRIGRDFFSHLSITLEVKPPNDLLFHGSKVGGILIESFPAHSVTVVGIGLNLVDDPRLQCQCSQPVTFLDPPIPKWRIIPLLHRAVLGTFSGPV
jgi:BirA family biotin operon repressor/biotin-[acetyl-CoA-carboxylase] ligase